MAASENSVPFGGFYVYDDSSETEKQLLSRRKNVTVPELNRTKTNTNMFTALHVNCRSIVNKDVDIKLLLSSLNTKPHVCVFTETWISSNHIALQFADYEHQHGDGISIYVQNGFQFLSISCPSVRTFECIGMIVKINDLQSVLVVCIYRPPNTDVNIFLSELEDLFDFFVTSYPTLDKWMVG